MRHKNFRKIYARNAIAFFKEGFPDAEQWTIAWIPAAIVFLISLPLTLSLGVGIKSLIDFFSRKEIPEEEMFRLNDKIDQSDEAALESLTMHLFTHKAQSTSSKKLIQTLQSTSTETSQAIIGSMQAKKVALQEEQFNAEGDADSILDRDTAIFNVKLNPAHQQALDDYHRSNSSHCNVQKLQKQKDVLKAYLGDEHNSGKKMQHVIYQHLFFAAEPVEVIEINPADRPILALAIE